MRTLPWRVRWAFARSSMAFLISEGWCEIIGWGRLLRSASVCNNRASLGGFVIFATPGIVLFANIGWPELLVVGVYRWMILVFLKGLVRNECRKRAKSSTRVSDCSSNITKSRSGLWFEYDCRCSWMSSMADTGIMLNPVSIVLRSPSVASDPEHTRIRSGVGVSRTERVCSISWMYYGHCQ